MFQKIYLVQPVSLRKLLIICSTFSSDVSVIEESSLKICAEKLFDQGVVVVCPHGVQYVHSPWYTVIAER